MLVGRVEGPGAPSDSSENDCILLLLLCREITGDEAHNSLLPSLKIF